MSTTHTLPISALDGLYEITDRAQVETYLAAYPFLVPLLVEAHAPIRRQFPDSPIFLEVIADPEVIQSEELVAIIAPTCPPDEATAGFDRFLDDWWLANMDAAEDRLSIAPNYR